MKWSLYFQCVGKYPTRNTEVFKHVCIKSMVSEFKGKVQTILIAQKLSRSCFVDGRNKNLNYLRFIPRTGHPVHEEAKSSAHFVFFRFWFGRYDVFIPFFFLNSTKKNLLSQLIKLIRGSKKTRSHTYIPMCIDKYTDVFYTYISVYIHYTYI